MTDDVFTVDSLREIALDRGWNYRENDPLFAERWGGPPFDTWSNAKRAADVITGDYRGVPAVVFCLLTSDENFLVSAVALPSALPSFALAPLAGAVDPGPYGHGFEAEDAGLASRYEVYATDAELAAAVLHVDAVSALRDHRDVDWRIEGRDLLAVELLGREVSSEEVTATLDTLIAIATGIPSDMYGRYPSAPSYPVS